MHSCNKNAFTLIELLVVIVIIGTCLQIFCSIVGVPGSLVYDFTATTVAPALGVSEGWIGALSAVVALSGLAFVLASIWAIATIGTFVRR